MKKFTTLDDHYQCVYDAGISKEEVIYLKNCDFADYKEKVYTNGNYDTYVRISLNRIRDTRTRPHRNKSNAARYSKPCVYILGSETGLYKIGQTTRHITQRASEISREANVDVWVEHTIYCDDYIELEKGLHDRYYGKRFCGEWFVLDDDDIEYLKSLPTNIDAIQRAKNKLDKLD